MTASLEGKVAIVTGSASGIGRESVRLLGRRGAAVVVADINADGGKQVAEELREEGARAIAIATDVADEAQVRRLVEGAVAEFGGLDILHNNAALVDSSVNARDDAITELDPDLFARVLRVNVIGYMLGAKYAIPQMIERGGGVIVNTASLAGVLSETTRPMYGTSKAAIIGLTRNIATQYGHHRIRAVAVAPGLVMTPAIAQTVTDEMLSAFMRHTMLPRPGEPSDIAELVAFLASDAGSYITGVTIPIDGGMGAHLPNYADDMAARLA
jgi:NAD(P)-dependent dehydrogenase (short-subunit alcohol dehydrogenase family)